ncbi:ribulose-1,5 bisphosphate carboxylase/oxygenase large subunit N-methyltransferase protein [Thalictrum thalictroides]|uniref:Ribulose-1,5 bisphosphate carboxylase/oxygenase large subunit N-methyltransferase protein n=1 Tax=Thalictrum thalictroides TaxID=46969 RepID=A0A7J6UR22_THATH|nr:ribulose-1,5 bisphosphate carboxylase/oxygenase large subunit N-methyltransferase protein [Thalictrum thalictroides]
MADAASIALYSTFIIPNHLSHTISSRNSNSYTSIPTPFLPIQTRRRNHHHHQTFVLRCCITTTTTVNQKKNPIPWGCDTDSLENASALQKWLSEAGLPPQKMNLQRVEVGERGLVALKNIRKGENLLFIPPSLVISADSEWSSPEAGQVLKRNSVPDWPFLATYLISEASFMKSSRWSSYISALPRQPYSLLYWTRSELDKYLVASQIRERAIERVNDVAGTYNDLRLRIFSKYPHLFPEEVFNMETFKWSFGILFSRLVRLPSMDGRVALVPWADMLNHSCEVETFLDYDKSSKGIVFTTDRPYQPGEQVFISYGKKSNGELLLSYGFVPKEGTNPSDSVELSLSLNKSDKCYKEKSEALRKHSLSVSQRFPLQIKGWPLELMAYAYLAVSPPDMRNSFEEMAAAASTKTSSKKDMRYLEIEEQALQFILDSCETSISKYTKFLQGSESMDLDVTSPKQINRKLFLKQLAVDLCTSERRILFRAQYILRRRLRDMRTGELKALTILNGFRKFFK